MPSKIEPVEITPRFYQLGTPFFPMYLSLGEQGMLIEGGTSATFDIIIEQIEVLGVNPERITHLALTHSHTDHIGALPRLKSVWPHLKIIASPLASKILSNDNMLKQFNIIDKGISDIMLSKSEIAKLPEKPERYDFNVDIISQEFDQYDLGNGIVWTAHAIPGHAGCQMAFFEKSEKTLAIGDATGFYHPETDVFWPNYFESLSQYAESIKKLAGLSAERVALSHNGVIKTNVQDFFRKALKSTVDYHREMITRTSSGESLKAIAEEKAQWVLGIADHMPFFVMPILCEVLIKQSLKANEAFDIGFEL